MQKRGGIKENNKKCLEWLETMNFHGLERLAVSKELVVILNSKAWRSDCPLQALPQKMKGCRSAYKIKWLITYKKNRLSKATSVTDIAELVRRIKIISCIRTATTEKDKI